MIKKVFKYIGIFLLVILGLFMILVVLIIFSALSSENKGSASSGSGNIILEFEGKEIPDFEKPDPIYADTMEEALTYYFKRPLYMSEVSYVIKILENNKYATMFYLSDKDLKEGTFVAVKFNIKVINDEKQYAVFDAICQGYSNTGRTKKISEKELNIFFQKIRVFDLLGDFSITEGNRFIFGGLDNEKVKTLKIEGQSPTEVIEYTLYGEKEYFWYYENLISDKPSSEFEIEIEE